MLLHEDDDLSFNRFFSSDRTYVFACFSFEVDARRVDLEGSGQVGSHRFTVRSDTDLLGENVDIDIFDRPKMKIPRGK